MQTIVDNYLYGFQLDNIDNEALFNKCLVMEDIIIKTTSPTEKGWHGNLTSAKNQEYNLMTFPVKELHQLYHEMVKNITPLLEKDTQYVLKSWMNVFAKAIELNGINIGLQNIKYGTGFIVLMLAKTKAQLIIKYQE
jgi:hypothetical protein